MLIVSLWPPVGHAKDTAFIVYVNQTKVVSKVGDSNDGTEPCHKCNRITHRGAIPCKEHGRCTKELMKKFGYIQAISPYYSFTRSRDSCERRNAGSCVTGYCGRAYHCTALDSNIRIERVGAIKGQILGFVSDDDTKDDKPFSARVAIGILGPIKSYDRLYKLMNNCTPASSEDQVKMFKMVADFAVLQISRVTKIPNILLNTSLGSYLRDLHSGRIKKTPTIKDLSGLRSRIDDAIANYCNPKNGNNASKACGCHNRGIKGSYTYDMFTAFTDVVNGLPKENAKCWFNACGDIGSSQGYLQVSNDYDTSKCQIPECSNVFFEHRSNASVGTLKQSINCNGHTSEIQSDEQINDGDSDTGNDGMLPTPPSSPGWIPDPPSPPKSVSTSSTPSTPPSPPSPPSGSTVSDYDSPTEPQASGKGLEIALIGIVILIGIGLVAMS